MILVGMSNDFLAVYLYEVNFGSLTTTYTSVEYPETSRANFGV